MKYHCELCDTIFDLEDGLVFYLEPHPELDGCPTEVFCENRCPCCGADWQYLEEVD